MTGDLPADAVRALNAIGFILVAEAEHGGFRFRRPGSVCETELVATPQAVGTWLIRLARQCPGGPWEVLPLNWLGSGSTAEAAVSTRWLATAFPAFLARFVLPVMEAPPFAGD